MHLTLYLTSALLAATPTLAANCQSVPGDMNGECVQYWSDSDCQGGQGSGEIGSYKPTCAGNCFQYDSFYSLKASGDSFFRDEL